MRASVSKRGAVRTIDEHISRGRGQGRGDAVQVSRQAYLASQARGVREPERHIEHIVLVVLAHGAGWVREAGKARAKDTHLRLRELVV